jgi:hypothetical protein
LLKQFPIGWDQQLATSTDWASNDGTVDKLVLGAALTADKLAISRSGADITLSFAGQSGSVRLVSEDSGSGTGLEQVVFGNGTVWSKQNLEAAYITQQQAAGRRASPASTRTMT